MIYLIFILNKACISVFGSELQKYEQHYYEENAYSAEIYDALEAFRPINSNDRPIYIKVNTWKVNEPVFYGICSTYITGNPIPISQSLNASIPHFLLYHEEIPKNSISPIGSEVTIICP